MTEPLQRDSSVDPVEARVRTIVGGLSTPGVSVMDCDPDLADTAEFCRAYDINPADSANAILVIGKASSAEVSPSYVLCLVLATHRLDVNKAVRKRLGVKKASFAPADLTRELTGMQIGGVTPFGMPVDIPVWVDAAVMQRSRVVVGGGSRAAKVIGPPAMLLELPSTEVVEGLANPIPD
ncbi:YbaK/EbsC family protein [Nakamurella sp. A5-74]|uniref:YbaK/EbsC family protein n=1 Tax=Nakamurella sp. A5-74 TaxID=3158264 RepID=A0AAU8DND3_9ACTN